MAANRFDQLIDQWDEKLRKAFLDAINELRNRAQVEQIARMLDKGDVDGAIRAVGLDPSAFRGLQRQIEAAFEAGGNATSSSIPTIRQADGFRLVVRFDVRNVNAELWLRNHSGDLIREVMDDQKQMVRDVLTQGMARGLNPRTVALDLVGRVGLSGQRQGGLIGLTSSQAQWVGRYASELIELKPEALTRKLRDKRFDGVVRRAIATDKEIPAETAIKMIAAYKNRALRYRAETIARTEAIEALHTSQEQAMQQAVSSGAVKADVVSFVWRSARDKRVRDTHRALDGQERPMGRAFDSALGPIRYPGDPRASAANTINCRCWREPKIDFFAGVK